MTIAGSTVSQALRKRVMHSLTPNLWIGYGTNETWYATIASPEMIRSTPGTIGKPSSGVRLRVVDNGGSEVGVGEVGEVEIHSPSVVESYLGASPASHPTFRDGWFRPRDLVRLMPDGQVIYCGRADNMMIVNGINIHPAEIEECLLSFPGIVEAVAFPGQHPVFQNLPVCAVALGPESPVESQRLKAYLAEHLGFRSPCRVYALPKLPRGVTGKVLVSEVVRLINAGAATVL